MAGNEEFLKYQETVFINYSNYKNKDSYDLYDNYSEVVEVFDKNLRGEELGFISEEEGEINYFVKLVRKGKVASNKVKINFINVRKLEKPVIIDEILNNNELSLFKDLKVDRVFRLNVQLHNAFAGYFYSNAREYSRIIHEIMNDESNETKAENKISFIRSNERDAIITSLKIANVKGYNFGYWNIENEQTVDFLDGLENAKVIEDSLVMNDATTFSDWDLEGSFLTNTYKFSDNNNSIYITYANRTSIEKQLGIDLFYFDQIRKFYVMIQYKMFRKEGNQWKYRPQSDNSFLEEKKRMEKLDLILNDQDNGSTVDYRLNSIPFYFKICKNIQEIKSNSQSNGIYIPLDYLIRLYNSNEVIGPRKGKYISTENVNKYLNNSTFIDLIKKGLIGTRAFDSDKISKIIREILKTGKSIVLAEKIK